jgi:protein TonB
MPYGVLRPAMARESNRNPRYPNQLQVMGVSGQVLVQFVIDTTGRADMRSFKVLRSSNPQFTEAVRTVLPSHRFYPAEERGCKVKMYVQMPFTFMIGGIDFGDLSPSSGMPPSWTPPMRPFP